MTACGFDADIVRSGLADDAPHEERANVERHLGECSSCRAVAALQARAHRAWKAGIARDDVFARAGCEQRLLAGPARAQGSWLGPAGYLAIGAATALLAMAAWTKYGAPPGTAAHAPTASALSTGGDRGTPAPSSLGPATAAAATPGAGGPGAGVVVIRSCATCTRMPGAVAAGTDAVTAGSALETTKPVDVPRGATLLLGWGVTGGPVDSGSGVDVVGPARVRVAPDAASAIVLEHGTAVAETRARGEVRTAIVRTIGTDASWRVEVTAGRTRVEVLRGTVSVESGADATRLLGAGEHIDIAPPPTPVSAPPPPADFGAPLPVPAGAPLGDLGSAEPRDAAADFGAASRAALSVGTTRERVAVWRRYLAGNPPSPHADVALAELANLLIDMGSIVEARVVVDVLSGRAPVAEAAAELDRARGRLLSHAATECLAHDLRTVCQEDGGDATKK